MLYVSFEVKPDYYTTLFLSLCQFYLISKSQYYMYFPNLDVSGKNWVREQFCNQQDFFELQTAKSQLIDSAACRLRFKLAEMNLIETFLYTEHSRYCNC